MLDYKLVSDQRWDLKIITKSSKRMLAYILSIFDICFRILLENLIIMDQPFSRQDHSWVKAEKYGSNHLYGFN